MRVMGYIKGSQESVVRAPDTKFGISQTKNTDIRQKCN